MSMNSGSTGDPSLIDPKKRREMVRIIKDNWRDEIVVAHVYRTMAEMEPDAHRRSLLLRMAENEEEHAKAWEGRLSELGEEVSLSDVDKEIKRQQRMARALGTDTMIRKIERAERDHVVHYTAQTEALGDERSTEILKSIIPDEEKHASRLQAMAAPGGSPKTRLESMLSGEKWHQVHTGGWLGDAIYGANDGLGAVFGTVSTMAGITTHSGNSKEVLLAGIACMLASALSMGGGAYLATKAEAEVHESELERERHEIEMDPEHEREELELMYQLKGFTEEEAKILSNRLTQDPEHFLATMAAEELGLSMQHPPNPITSAISGTLATAVGAFLPLIPFFFIKGMPAVVWSGIISLVAHFGIGAAKTLVTGRSWFASGMEMTIVGVIMAVITYLIGLLLGANVGG